MNKCVDPALGALLPAYELGALSEADEKRLEIHLMKCEHCLKELLAFQQYAEVLRDSEKIREALTRQARADARPTPVKTLIQHLWPDAPLLFRPAVSLLIVLLMMVPALVGLRALIGSGEAIRPVQLIRLIPNRSAGVQSLSIGSGLDAAISFAVPDYTPGRLYEVSVIDDRGESIVHLSSFGSVDERGMGQIIVPHRKMTPGSYSLIVAGSDNESADGKLIYTFLIEP